MIATLKPEHAGLYVDWTARLHVCYRVTTKFYHAVKVSRRGLMLATVKRSKASMRGFRKLEKDQAQQTLRKIIEATEHKKTGQHVLDILHAVLLFLIPDEGPRESGSGDVSTSTSADTEEISRAGAAG